KPSSQTLIFHGCRVKSTPPSFRIKLNDNQASNATDSILEDFDPFISIIPGGFKLSAIRIDNGCNTSRTQVFFGWGTRFGLPYCGSGIVRRIPPITSPALKSLLGLLLCTL